MELQEKYEQLKQIFKDMKSVAVAFSGGVDSTLLIKVAHDVLGDQAIAITVDAPNFPRREMSEAADFCKEEGIRQIRIPFNPLEVEGFVENPPERCYFCKKALFTNMLEEIKKQGIDYLVEGSNMDDLGDYRPGLKAIAELQVASPLRQATLTKAEIRQLSKQLELDTYCKPSYACLASRFVYGEPITTEKMASVEKAEQKLLDLGFTNMRVRLHGNLARIEVPADNIEFLASEKIRQQITEYFKELGFAYTTMDLSGYRTGSMNETL